MNPRELHKWYVDCGLINERETYTSAATTTIDDLTLPDDLKKTIQDVIISPLQDPEEQDWPQGILLDGPSGTGKSEIGKAISATLGFPIIRMSIGTQGGIYINETAKNIQESFDKARKQARNHPKKACILQLEECETLLRDRATMTSSHSYRTDDVTQFLQDWDICINQNLKVIILGTTNFKSQMDAAILGRFAIHQHIPLPDALFREKLIQFFETKKELPTMDSGTLSQIVTGTENLSIRKITRIFDAISNQRKAKKRRNPSITHEAITLVEFNQAKQVTGG